MDTLLFDWDGTLFDSLGVLYRANVVVMEAFGLPFDEATYRRHFDPDWRILYRRLGVPEDRLEEANERWHVAFDRASSTPLLPGAEAALRRLAAAGHRLGLVTAGQRWLVEPQLERTAVGELFAACVYGDDTLEQKPDPAPLRLALEQLGVAADPERVAYVGDAPTDMRMARAVGVRAVGIVSLLGESGSLEAAGAQEVAPSVAAWVDRAVARGDLRAAAS